MYVYSLFSIFPSLLLLSLLLYFPSFIKKENKSLNSKAKGMYQKKYRTHSYQFIPDLSPPSRAFVGAYNLMG